MHLIAVAKLPPLCLNAFKAESHLLRATKLSDNNDWQRSDIFDKKWDWFDLIEVEQVCFIDDWDFDLYSSPLTIVASHLADVKYLTEDYSLLHFFTS
jgi:hypothetical protein